MSVPSDGKLKFPGNLVSSIIFTLLLMYGNKYQRRWKWHTAGSIGRP